MYRAQIEKTVEPIIFDRLRKFRDYSRPGVSVEEFAAVVNEELRPDVRRVSLLISLLQSMGCEPSGEALELGCGYGFLLFPMALLNPKLHWTAVEHPDRSFFCREDFQQALREYKCELP